MHTIKVGASPARPRRFGRAFGERYADEASTAGSGAGSALQPSRIVGIARADPLILGLYIGEQLDDQGVGAEVVAEKRRAIAHIAVEGGAEIGAGAEQRAAIVVAAGLLAARTRQPGA